MSIHILEQLSLLAQRLDRKMQESAVCQGSQAKRRSGGAWDGKRLDKISSSKEGGCNVARADISRADVIKIKVDTGIPRCYYEASATVSGGNAKDIKVGTGKSYQEIEFYYVHRFLDYYDMLTRFREELIKALRETLPEDEK